MFLLDDLDKKELIQIIEKLEKENKELKEKIYGKIEVKDYSKKYQILLIIFLVKLNQYVCLMN